MIQPMTSGPCVFPGDRRAVGNAVPVWPSVPRPRYRPPQSAPAPIAAPRVRSRARRRPQRIPVALYLRRAQMLLAAAVIVGAAGAAGQRLWQVVLHPAPPAAAMTIRTVRPGDSLWSLARRYGDPRLGIRDRVDALARANGLSDTSTLMPGQKLVVPGR